MSIVKSYTTPRLLSNARFCYVKLFTKLHKKLYDKTSLLSLHTFNLC